MKYSVQFLKNAHKGSSCHEDEIINSSLCACFYCYEMFSPSEIDDWIDEGARGKTAACPKCSIDSVLSSKYPIDDKEFLVEMYKYWF